MAPPVGATPYAARPRRTRARLGLAAFVVAEIVVLVLVGRWIGVGWTLLALVAGFVLGVGVIARTGRDAFRSLGDAARGGTPPQGRVLGDRAVALAGGVLLLLPGFLSDLVGLVCVLPWTRSAARRLLGAALGTRFEAYAVRQGFGSQTWPGGAGPDVVRGEVRDSD